MYWGYGLSELDDEIAAFNKYVVAGGSWPKLTSENYFMGGKLVVSTAEIARDHRIDLFAGDRGRRVAILVVGPYNISKYYTKLHADWILLAIGISYFFKDVALFFPPDGVVRPFQRWLRQYDPDQKLTLHLVKENSDGAFRVVGRNDFIDDETSSEEREDEAAARQADEDAIAAAFSCGPTRE